MISVGMEFGLELIWCFLNPLLLVFMIRLSSYNPLGHGWDEFKDEWV